MPKTKIKFGTSGWRGIIGDDFTFANVRLVVQAICNCIKNNKVSGRPVIVGYDTRFMGEEFARETIKVLAANKIKALLCDRDTPTPVIAHEIIKKKAAGGINFTASHNPHQYNGIKFSPEWGGPALPETTQQIEKEIKGIKEADIKSISFDKANDKGLVKLTDPRKSYFKTLKNKLDVNTLTNSNLCVAIDPLYGTATGYIDKIFWRGIALAV